MLEGIENEPLLVNAIGHSAGLLLFAGFIILYLRDHSHRRNSREMLPAITASLALLWNLGSLFVLGATSGLYAPSDLIAALSFSVLSLLPATLLQSALAGQHRAIWALGYGVSGTAVGLHLAELLRPDVRFHLTALWLIIAGFGVLTVTAMLTAQRTRSRTAMSMCLFVFAISFVHFSHGHVREAWSSEVALHHAGIPLALYVLLQDYRFLLVDAFLRFFVNALVAGGFIVLALAVNARFQLLHRANENPFIAGILLVGACLVLIALVFVRGKLQLALTRIVFGRSDPESAIRRIREAAQAADGERVFLQAAAAIAGEFVRAAQNRVEQLTAEYQLPIPAEPTLLYDSAPATRLLASQVSWALVCVPARFTKGDAALIFLGRRDGGRKSACGGGGTACMAASLRMRIEDSIVDLIYRGREFAQRLNTNPLATYLTYARKVCDGALPRYLLGVRELILVEESSSEMYLIFPTRERFEAERDFTLTVA